MARAFDVANYLIRLGTAEDEPQYLTHLQLQKLLYYTQGWSLALRDAPLFGERIEAWAHGPVVRDVYPAFAAYGSLPITSIVATTDDPGYDCPSDLSDDECDLITAVWSVYKKYSASHLREMTHNERPWIEARGQLGPADRCDREITFASMERYFSKLAED
jgi:uncharacterized phage-associated protein